MSKKIREARAQSRRWKIGAATGAIIGTALVVGILFAISAAASTQATPCTTNQHLVGSNFEIDTNANLKVDGPADCIDWLAGGAGTSYRTGVSAKSDKATGSGDDSFGQGTSENDANPTIVDGSIPPNKSDLKQFGVFTETGSSGKFLELFWSRVQNPSGTTNMDFELNQKFCDLTATPTNCANNGTNFPAETPIRTAGDKLVTYDLSKGGTVPTISIRTWDGSQWGSATVISGGGTAACTTQAITNCAVGTVNTTAIPQNEGGALGSQDAFTFGEAAISYTALFPSGNSGCGKFGSAYLKSRSSDSFSAELKDFIGPENVNITNCTGLTTQATTSVTIGSSISDTATLTGASAGATGSITFKLYSDSSCSTLVTTLTNSNVNGPGNYSSGTYTPLAVGTYYWVASYSGDGNNVATASTCGDANESSVVGKKSPGLSTSAAASVIVGSPISDTATLTGATSDAGGTITFKLYSDSSCSTLVTTLTNSSVNGNGNYGSGNYTPSAVGTYYWVAS
jgi:hypothetical protein